MNAVVYLYLASQTGPAVYRVLCICEGPLNYRYTFTLLSHAVFSIPACMYL